MLANLGHIARLHNLEIRQQSRLSQSLLVPVFPEWLTEADVVPDGTVTDESLLRGVGDRVDEPGFDGPIPLNVTAVEWNRVGCSSG